MDNLRRTVMAAGASIDNVAHVSFFAKKQADRLLDELIRHPANIHHCTGHPITWRHRCL